MSEEETKDAQLLSVVYPEDKEKLRERTDSMSGFMGELLSAWLEYEEEMDVRADLEDTDVLILRTYKNAIEKNIEVLKSQRDKLQKEIDKRTDDDEDEVLVTVRLDAESLDL